MKLNIHSCFRIKTKFLCDVKTEKIFTPTHNIENPETGETALEKGRDYVMMGHEDHPEFTKLREQLGDEGYISIQRGWWNGDRVIKPFFLNGHKFEEHDSFPCAAALKGTLR